MACEVVTFQMDGSTGSQTVSLSNGDLNANAVIVQSVHTTNLGTINAALNHCTGVWSDKGAQCCVHARRADGSSKSADGATQTAVYTLYNSSGSMIEEFNITGTSAGSVTINIGTTGGSQKYVNMLCIEADDAWVGYELNKTSTGNKTHGDDSGNGSLDFEGDALFAIMGHNTGMDSTHASARDSTGWAISSSNRGTIGNSFKDGAATRKSIHSTTDITRVYNTAATPITVSEADFVSWASGEFVLNWQTIHTSPLYCAFLVLKGQVWLDETYALRTSAGITDVTAPGFEPDFVFEQSNRATGTTATTSYAHSWGFCANDAGAGAGSTGCCYSNGGASQANIDREINGTAQNNTLMLREDSASATVLKKFHVQDFDADGFTRDYDTADGTAMNGMTFAYAKAAVSGISVPVAMHHYTKNIGAG